MLNAGAPIVSNIEIAKVLVAEASNSKTIKVAIPVPQIISESMFIFHVAFYFRHAGLLHIERHAIGICHHEVFYGG